MGLIRQSSTKMDKKEHQVKNRMQINNFMDREDRNKKKINIENNEKKQVREHYKHLLLYYTFL